MTPKITQKSQTYLVGVKMTMSFANYKVEELWKNFIPRRKEINLALNDDLISMTIYGNDHFLNFKPTNLFDKWACKEVSAIDSLPPGMETYILPSGLYAVFQYKGLHNDPAVYQYIFGKWLPGSVYSLDDRPHFEILGSKYKNNSPDSEEEIWIPVKLR